MINLFDGDAPVPLSSSGPPRHGGTTWSLTRALIYTTGRASSFLASATCGPWLRVRTTAGLEPAPRAWPGVE